MKVATLSCLALFAGALVVNGAALADTAKTKPGAAPIDPEVARLATLTRRNGVLRIVRSWKDEVSVDLTLWKDWKMHPRDTSEGSKRLVKRLQGATARAAQELNQIACDGDENLGEVVNLAFAASAELDPGVVKSTIISAACSGGFLRATVKVPTS
jgi:hypothetical protein